MMKPSEDRTMPSADEVRVWLVERTYSDDEQNIIILIYATPDGTHSYRMERALTSFTDERDTTAAVDVDPSNLSSVDDPELREQYAEEVKRKRTEYSPMDAI